LIQIHTYSHPGSSATPFINELPVHPVFGEKKGITLQLKGRSFVHEPISSYVKGSGFVQKCISSYVKGNGFVQKGPLVTAEGCVFIQKCPLVTAKNNTFIQKCLPVTAKNNTFIQKCPPLTAKGAGFTQNDLPPYHSKDLLLQGKSPFGALFANDAKPATYRIYYQQFFINLSRNFSREGGPGLKSKHLCLIDNYQPPLLAG
jgi:hypothetical protein